MQGIGNQQDSSDAAPVRCPVCGQSNQPMRYCQHVRWTFDQGDPIDFARFAVETSPYVTARGGKSSDLTRTWWALNGDWVVEQVELRFAATDGYVFGEIADLDMLARDIWKRYRPDPVVPDMRRY